MSAAEELLIEVLRSPVNHRGVRARGDWAYPYEARRLDTDLIGRIREHVAEAREAESFPVPEYPELDIRSLLPAWLRPLWRFIPH